ncbi:PolC-type DNA polymerase III [Peptoniphilus catoniae]|uniref:PolC-type DNA polymerase III n=1 Tax=Peptoniphilus catoniae TaxID=1660341 RepID=UPI0010FE244E|nr:PolC-type DNA polymerase III [Peptoniphilus catoniae]
MIEFIDVLKKLNIRPEDFRDISFNEISFKDINFKENILDLEIFVESKKEVDESLKQKFYENLSKELKGLNLKITYLIKEDIYKNKKELIKDYIVKLSPSCISCLEDISIDIEENENSIDITIPNEGIYYSITSKNFEDDLKNDMSLFKNYKINLKLSDKVCKCNDDNIKGYMEDLSLMESDLIKNINNTTSIKDKKPSRKSKSGFSYGKKEILGFTTIKDISINSNKVTVKTEIFNIETKEIKSGRFLVSLSITDSTSSILAKIFLTSEKLEEFSDNVKVGDTYIITGNVQYDSYSKDDNIMIRYLEKSEKIMREDKSQEKRVELRLHTKMSAMSGLTSFKDFTKTASNWGMSAIAITDNADVQGFPEAMEASNQDGIKVIYGLDANFVDDLTPIVTNYKENSNSFVVFDIETTGFSPRTDKITEIGAVKIIDGKIVDRYSQLVNPEKSIPKKVEELTGLSNALLESEPKIEDIIGDFYDFCNGSVLVAHNAGFDSSFIRRDFTNNGYKFDYAVLDTLQLSRAVVKGTKRYNLSTLSKKLGVSLVNAHRAVNDAEATAEVFLKMMELADKEYNVSKLSDINSLIKNIEPASLFESPVSILVKTQEGLKNLYKLVSKSHLNYVNRVAKVPRTLLDTYREGLIIGSGTSYSQLFRAVYNGLDDEEIKKIASYYDYIEIQPVENNLNFLAQGLVRDLDELKGINKKLYRIGKDLNIPVVATGDVFYLEEEDDLARRIVLSGQRLKFDNDWNTPKSLYFKTTDEMLSEFSYLGEKEAYEVVIENSNKISNMTKDLKPIPDGKYPPVIEGADEDLKTMCYKKAHEIYGDNLPDIVEKRLDKELNSIISNGYSVLYIIAQKLVEKSNKDGYLVGSRGSVGSSFAATMSSITEVNPLPAHYVCPRCKYSDFSHSDYDSGVDLPDANCPNCGHELKKDGHNIPFEVFLGFKGDKEPDIDLNFAGEYQPSAHKYTEDLFGKGYVFRAGTIGTIAEKTAYGYVKNYFEDKDIRALEIERLVQKIVGVKRTSGQHPGGVMICPKSKDIFDFTPIQYPADDAKSGVITTHFDYNFIHGKILKLDILGHDGPTIIRMLEDITGLDSTTIPLNDKNTLSLFSTSEALNLDENIFNTPTGTLGIPEFGTGFVKQMLLETKPKSFSELVRISGLSHGTDVWTNNAQDLVKEGKATLSNVISTREDIMLYLIRAGAENKIAFDTMERVRKGRGLTDEQKEVIKTLDLPDWYIESCQKIKYMFPKAHAVAYVMLSFRIAYYKLNYPLAFYATYFTNKLQDFDGELIIQGVEAVKLKVDSLKNSDEKLSVKEKSQLNILELVLEMFSRGFEFKNADLYKSDSFRFKVDGDKILFPIRAYVGIGEQVANNIVEASKEKEYLSIEDFMNKTKATKSVVDILKRNGVLNNLPDSNQLSLFNMI